MYKVYLELPQFHVPAHMLGYPAEQNIPQVLFCSTDSSVLLHLLDPKLVYTSPLCQHSRLYEDDASLYLFAKVNYSFIATLIWEKPKYMHDKAGFSTQIQGWLILLTFLLLLSVCSYKTIVVLSVKKERLLLWVWVANTSCQSHLEQGEVTWEGNFTLKCLKLLPSS